GHGNGDRAPSLRRPRAPEVARRGRDDPGWRRVQRSAQWHQDAVSLRGRERRPRACPPQVRRARGLAAGGAGVTDPDRIPYPHVEIRDGRAWVCGTKVRVLRLSLWWDRGQGLPVATIMRRYPQLNPAQ